MFGRLLVTLGLKAGRSAAELTDAERALDIAEVGPDPVFGAGVTLLGILMMGISGARDAHYPFDVGVLVAVVGAGIFVGSVALSAVKQRNLAAERDTQDGGDASADG